MAIVLIASLEATVTTASKSRSVCTAKLADTLGSFSRTRSISALVFHVLNKRTQFG
jgi:hypothetical protein